MLKLLWVGALSVAACGAAAAGDAAMGKAKSDAVCSECHEKADWAGEDAASLEAKIASVVAGKTKHKKKLSLTDEEIKGIAAYWAEPTK
jgi:mono/diheme cytochrome c family protein